MPGWRCCGNCWVRCGRGCRLLASGSGLARGGSSSTQHSHLKSLQERLPRHPSRSSTWWWRLLLLLLRGRRRSLLEPL
jgi:hypothetical protein